MKSSPRIAYRVSSIPYEDSFLESEHRRFINGRHKFLFETDKQNSLNNGEPTSTEIKQQELLVHPKPSRRPRPKPQPKEVLGSAHHVPLTLTCSDYTQALQLSLPLNSVRALMVKDLWIRWKEMQTNNRPIWQTNVLKDSLVQLDPNTTQLKSLYNNIKGFITPPLDTKSTVSDKLTYDIKELFAGAIKSGYFYSTFNTAYIEVRQQRQVTKKTAKQIAFAYSHLSKSKQMIQTPPKYKVPLHAGHFKLPIKIVSINDPKKVLFQSMTYIKRLELLPGLSSFKILPSHGLYDKITKDMRIIHPLTSDTLSTYNSDQPITLFNPKPLPKLVPIIKLTNIQDTNLRKSISADPNSKISKSLMVALPSPYITPVFPGNDELDFKLAKMFRINVKKSIDIDGQVKFHNFLDVLSPFLSEAVDQETGEKNSVFNYKVLQIPQPEDSQLDEKPVESIKVDKDLGSIPIAAANAAIYEFLKQKLIPCVPETEYFPHDDCEIPGVVEPVIAQEWRVDVAKVLEYTQLGKYLKPDLHGPIRDELNQIVDSPPSGNINAVVTQNEFKSIKDFKMSYNANTPGDAKPLFGITNACLEFSNPKRLEERVFKPYDLSKTIHLENWVKSVAALVLDWTQDNSVFSQPPIVFENDSNLKKKLLVMMSLFSPTVQPAPINGPLFDPQNPQMAINLANANRPILDSVIIGQDIYGPRDMNLSETWNIKALKYFRLGADVLDIVPSVLQVPGHGIYTEEKIRNTGIRYTTKSFDFQRYLLIDSLNPAPASANDSLWNSITFDDVQGVFSAFYYLRDSRHKFAHQLFYRKDAITDSEFGFNLTESQYREFALPYESYMLYSLQKTTMNVTKLMNKKQFYEAKQLVDQIILQASGHYLTALITDMLDHKSLPQTRLHVARVIYEKVIKTVCMLAYPFYPYVSLHVYEFFERGDNDANMGYGKASAHHKLQADAHSANIFGTPVNAASTQHDHFTDFLGGYKLTKERDYVPGHVMMKICDEIELVIQQGLVSRDRVRAYITLSNNKQGSAVDRQPTRELIKSLFGYSNRIDVNKHITILIKRMLRVLRVDMPANHAVYNSGRVATRKIYKGLYLHVFDDEGWLSKDQFEQGKKKLEEYVFGKEPLPQDT